MAADYIFAPVCARLGTGFIQTLDRALVLEKVLCYRGNGKTPG